MKPVRDIPNGMTNANAVIACRLEEATKLLAAISARLERDYHQDTTNMGWHDAGSLCHTVEQIERVADAAGVRY